MSINKNRLIQVIFRSKKFDNYNLFCNLILIPTIAENPISHKVVKESSILNLIKYNLTFFNFSTPTKNHLRPTVAIHTLEMSGLNSRNKN